MISGSLVGDKALVARFGRMPAAIKQSIDDAVMRLGFELQARVQTQKLSGQVLHVRTGRLRSSITQRFQSTTTTAYTFVGTNVSYGVDWERGIKAHDIVPVNKKALHFFVGGAEVFAKRVRIPAQAPRKFLEPALQEMKPQIIKELTAAMNAAGNAALKS